LVTWGYVQFQQKWQRRWMAVSLAGVLFALNTDWEVTIFLAIVLSVLLFTSYFAFRWFGRVDARRFGQWWSISVIFSVITVAGYLAYVNHVGALDQLLGQEVKRSKGSDVMLSVVLQSRSYWIDLTFTPLAITVGKIAAPIFLYRFLLLRRPV